MEGIIEEEEAGISLLELKSCEGGSVTGLQKFKGIQEYWFMKDADDMMADPDDKSPSDNIIARDTHVNITVKEDKGNMQCLHWRTPVCWRFVQNCIRNGICVKRGNRYVLWIWGRVNIGFTLGCEV